jgi:tetratricopeptide (TPR) repeat protein
MKKVSSGHISPSLSSFSLHIVKGLDVGKMIHLEPHREYLVGRQTGCDIQIDPSDKSASRKHAVLKISEDRIVIENLSRTNPVRINNKPIEQFTSKGTDQFEIGNTLFELKKAGSGDQAAKNKRDQLKKKKVLLLFVIVLVLVTGIYFMLSSGKELTEERMITSKTAPGTLTSTTPELPAQIPSALQAPGQNPEVSLETRERANDAFRQGMFFYDARNLSRAMDQWTEAIRIDPTHLEARNWFLKAEREIEEKIKAHYQKAITHYKYMRYETAAHEFRIVVELSRNKGSDIYIDSLRYLDELQRK